MLFDALLVCALGAGPTPAIANPAPVQESRRGSTQESRQDSKKNKGLPGRRPPGQGSRDEKGEQSGDAGRVAPKGGSSLGPSTAGPMTEAARARFATRQRCVEELVSGKLGAEALAGFLPIRRAPVSEDALARLARELQSAYGGGRIQVFHFNALLGTLREEMTQRAILVSREQLALSELFASWKEEDRPSVPKVEAAFRAVQLEARRGSLRTRLAPERQLVVQKMRASLFVEASPEEAIEARVEVPREEDLLGLWSADEAAAAGSGRELAKALLAGWSRPEADRIDRILDVVVELAAWIDDGKRKRLSVEERQAELKAALLLAGFDEARSTELAGIGRRLAQDRVKAKKKDG